MRLLVALFILVSPTLAFASPNSPLRPSRTTRSLELEVHARQEPAATPTFPATPTTCPKCGAHYSDTIASCSDAEAAFQDPQQIILNPAAFIAVIECGCTDTFQSVYAACADCFLKTNQTQFLAPPGSPKTINPSAVLNGLREVCALAASLLGGVTSSSSSDGGATSATTPTPSPSPSPSPTTLSPTTFTTLDDTSSTGSAVPSGDNGIGQGQGMDGSSSAPASASSTGAATTLHMDRLGGTAVLVGWLLRTVL